jgi:cytoskeletal protein RodZ
VHSFCVFIPLLEISPLQIIYEYGQTQKAQRQQTTAEIIIFRWHIASRGNMHRIRKSQKAGGVRTMKTIRILALITTLALGFALRSAQAQTQDTTSSDQYSTQSTDPTATNTSPAMSGSATVQQDQTSVSITDPFSTLDPNSYAGELTNDTTSKFYDPQANRVQTDVNDSGGN